MPVSAPAAAPLSDGEDFATALARGERVLARRDTVMRGLIRAHGPCRVRPQPRSPYRALMQAVAHQQLHANAAAAILKRFMALAPGGGFPKPAAVLAMRAEDLRAVGFSAAKAAALRDIAAKTLEGTVPSARVARGMSDEALIAELTRVRGVGRWTVEMLLIFTLGRLDVWPVDDYGVRAGYAAAYGGGDMPKPKALLSVGEAWRPYRSLAAWYLWRAADAAKAAKAAKASKRA
jgi:DNA-3-methyladenine glycosylase II